MPGGTGNATAPGDGRLSAAQLPLNTSSGGQALTAGAFTSGALSLIGLPGVSIVFNNDGANPMTVQVSVFVQDITSTYDLPAFVVAAGADAFVSFDHIAARGAFYTVTGVGVESFRALLSATAT
jgi:hypothetical protein